MPAFSHAQRNPCEATTGHGTRTRAQYGDRTGQPATSLTAWRATSASNSSSANGLPR